jgi:hypothetical protein
MSNSNTDALLNSFAIRSFRDTADRDYIHARLAYKARLIPQFQWSALHCLEKYAKCILLLNRIPAKELKHEISGALDLVEKHGKFKIELPTKSLELIKHLETSARHRYFEVSYFSFSSEITYLDLTVSELRRYCQCLFINQAGIHPISFMDGMIQKIRTAAKSCPKNTCIDDGWLESVLRNKSHPARSALIWQNPFFSSKNRKRIRLPNYIEGGNSPLFLNPEILNEVLKYVYLPNQMVKGWKEELKLRAENS